MRLAGQPGPAPTEAAAPAPPAAAPAAPADASPVEVVRGRDLTVRFEARRCIHSRHCVMDAPSVFKANTPGEWIHPDTVSAEALVMLVLGGTGRLSGALVGATVFTLLHHTAASINPYHWLFVIGGALMVVVLVPPARVWAWLKSRRAAR